VLGGGYLAVPRNAPHRAQALALVRHLLGRDAQAALARTLGWFSPRRDVELAAPDGVLGGYAAMRDAVRPRPGGSGYPALSRAWQEAFRAVVLDRVAPAAALAAGARRLAVGR
jgi:ABC-type glycerol-3-phosphate transport system substrate-binding protein